MFFLLLLQAYSVISQKLSLSYIPSPPFSSSSSVYDKNTSTFITHSGLSLYDTYIEDTALFYLDSMSNQWRYTTQQNLVSPGVRASYGSFLYNGFYYIFGGVGPSGLYNDLWRYSIEDSYWEIVPCNSYISPRSGFAYTSFTYNSTFYFAVLGGNSYSDAGYLYDFYLLDVEAATWIAKANYSSCSHNALSGSQLQFISPMLFLFGGNSIISNNMIFYNNTCITDLSFNSSQNKWNKVFTQGTPIASTEGGSCSYGNSIYYFFGWTIESNEQIDSASIFRLSASNISAGWQPLSVSPTITGIPRNSFSYFCDGNSFYILGGVSNGIAQSSILNITLSNDPILNYSTILNCSYYAQRRNKASMVYISGGFYLFGGQDKGKVLQSLDFFDLGTNQWKSLGFYGDYPSARVDHAAASQGEYMIIGGGIDETGKFLQDFFMFDSATLIWSALNPGSSSNQPPPIANTCLMMKLPFVYYVGGRQQNLLTLNLWEYNTNTQNFTLIYQFNPQTDIGIYKHGCSISQDNNNNTIIYTYSGSKTLSDQPFCGVYKFNLSSPVITPELVMAKTQYMACRTESAYASIDQKYVIYAGGQRFRKESFSDIWVIDLNNSKEKYIVSMPYSMYSSAFSFINETLYIFSGFTNNILMPNSVSSDLFQQVSLKLSPVNLKFDANQNCGPGMQFFDDNSTCVFCPPGTYGEGGSCLNCPMGTTNLGYGATSAIQCIPCNFGFYSVYPNNSCQACPINMTCYIGTGNNTLNTTILTKLQKYAKHNSQPGIYEPPDISNETYITYIIAGGLLFIFSLSFLLSYRIRTICSYFDFYKNLHFESFIEDHSNPADDSPLTPSEIGGYCTVLTMIVFMAVLVINILSYVYTNRVEQITLVPINALLEKADFGGEMFKMNFISSSYRGNCSTSTFNVIVSKGFSIELNNVKENEAYCELEYEFSKNGIITTGDSIQLQSKSKTGFASDFIIRLSTGSSIPGSDSVTGQIIISDQGSVFLGPQPTTFLFELLPAYYTSVDQFNNENSRTGYRLSSSNKPISGTQVIRDDIPLYSNLIINIGFINGEIGINTYEYLTEDLVAFLVLILGDLPGLIVLVSMILWLLEYAHSLHQGKGSGRLELALEKIKSKKAKNSSTLITTTLNP